jgi:hypothetical protein
VRKATVEVDRDGARVRVHGGRADGWPQPELAAVLYVGGPDRELATVATDARVQGVDVVYKLAEGAPGGVFEKLVDRGLIQVDCSSGLAIVKPPSDGVNGTHLRGSRDRW